MNSLSMCTREAYFLCIIYMRNGSAYHRWGVYTMGVIEDTTGCISWVIRHQRTQTQQDTNWGPLRGPQWVFWIVLGSLVADHPGYAPGCILYYPHSVNPPSTICRIWIPWSNKREIGKGWEHGWEDIWKTG